MLNRLLFAWRRRGRRSGMARISVPIAIPVALALVIGVVVVITGRSNATNLNESALGAFASASASASPAATSPATTTAANVSCDIIIPAHPFTARGLATPYQLTGTDGQSPAASGCEMTNAVNLGAFVQATILDPDTGRLYIYDPLVVTQGTTPAVAPVVPVLP